MIICIGCSWTHGVEIPKEDPWNYAWPKLLADKLDTDAVNLGEPSASNEGIVINFLTYIANNDVPKDTIAIMQTTDFDRKAAFRKKSLLEESDNVPANEWVSRHDYWVSLHAADGKYPELMPCLEAYLKEEHCVIEQVSRNFLQILQFQMICRSLGIRHYVKPAWCHPAHYLKHYISNIKTLNINNGIDWHVVAKEPMIQDIFWEAGDKKVWDWEEMTIPLKDDHKVAGDLMYDHHPTEKGHEIIAEELYKWIND